MTTNLINTTRPSTFRGPVATELVTVTRNHLRRRRMIAIGAGTGRGFVITTGGAATVAPADFAEAVAEVDSRQQVQWATAQHDEVDGEKVGEEFSRTPFLY